jgi:hypothetical protein
MSLSDSSSHGAGGFRTFRQTSRDRLLQEMLHATRTGKGSAEWKVCVCVCVCDFFPPLSCSSFPQQLSVCSFFSIIYNKWATTDWLMKCTATNRLIDYATAAAVADEIGIVMAAAPSTTAAIAMPDEEDYVLMMMMQVVNDTDKQAYDHCHQSFVMFFFFGFFAGSYHGRSYCEGDVVYL